MMRSSLPVWRVLIAPVLLCVSVRAQLEEIYSIPNNPHQTRVHSNVYSNDCISGRTGFRCDQKTCPIGLSWTAGNMEAGDSPFSPLNSVEGTTSGQHTYTVCSSAGVCNHLTGRCECRRGYTGSACQRQVCFRSCSGHGVCRSNVELVASNLGSEVTNFWDHTITWCECDPRYSGPTCASRMCPTHANPHCDTEVYDDVQAVDVNGLGPDDHFALTFKSQYNEKFVTFPVHKFDEPARLQLALETLPTRLLPHVSVTKSSSVFYVTFLDGSTPGKQATMQCNQNRDDSTCESGVNPKLTLSAGATCSVTHVGAPELNTSLEYTPAAVCSNRGLCNSETGLCKCFRGAGGNACEESVTRS